MQPGKATQTSRLALQGPQSLRLQASYSFADNLFETRLTASPRPVLEVCPRSHQPGRILKPRPERTPMGEAIQLVLAANGHSRDLTDDVHEFVEIQNAGTSPVDLSGWTLAGGISYTFPANTAIAPGAFRVIAGNPRRLAIVYKRHPHSLRHVRLYRYRASRRPGGHDGHGDVHR